MIRRLLGAALGAALLALTTTAAADGAPPLRDPGNRFTIELPAGARPAPLPEGVVLARRLAGGLTVTVSRIEHPNRDARRGVDRYFEQVERGVAEATPHYRRLGKTLHRIGQVPVLDLHVRRGPREARERVSMRFLFFWRYSLVLTVAGPERAVAKARRPVRRLLASFQPYIVD